ncbi:hypothetical protein BH24ACT4_BH24ACT4_21520 [soil metagenome]
MPESSTAMRTSSRPWVTPQARSTAALVWPQWFWIEDPRSPEESRRDVSS